MTGDSIGPYRVIDKLGEGGMGEVYRAHDTRLNRQVAIKVLPASVAADADRLARFRREAQVLAALNHPNIAQIFGLEEAAAGEGSAAGARRSALVMELVEGEDLSVRIGRGPIPLEDVLPIARQIAEALEVAHDRGIVHRDLKPANVKVRGDGTVKVLDFGLAKAMDPDAAGAPGEAGANTKSPTMSVQATQAGIILGTAAYMAPEQAKGRAVDRRADIWAFGVLVYEMITGRRAFNADDVSDTLAAVLLREVDWSALPSTVPPALRTLLHDCLVRDPRQRLRDIGEARRIIDRIISGAAEPAAPGAAPAPPPRASLPTKVAWAAAVAGVAGAAAIAFVHFRETAPVPQTVRFQVQSPDPAGILNFAISPDGRYLTFSTGRGISERRLWVRPIDRIEARALPGTESVQTADDQVFWSPDGRHIGFIARNQLKKVPVAGGPPQTLAAVTPITVAAWGPGGVLLVVHGAGSPIQRLAETAGVPVDLIKPGEGEIADRPRFLPGGRHFVYHVTGGPANSNGIYVASLDGGAAKRLLPDATAARYAPPAQPGAPGYLLFVRDSTLMAQPFDAEALAIAGDAVPVAESVRSFSVSDGGTLAYMGRAQSRRDNLVWLDRGGREIAAPTVVPGGIDSFRLSPDGASVAFSRDSEGNVDIWVKDLNRGPETRITSDPSMENLPVWSHDGLRVLWASRRGGRGFDLHIKPASGAGDEERLIEMGTVNGWATDWSRDGRFVLYQRPGDKTAQDLWIAPQPGAAPAGDGKPFPYLNSPFNESNGVFSPDGRWVAYESDESGRLEVYVQAFPLTRVKARMSTGGGTSPAWSAKGELFYLAPDRGLMAVPYRAAADTFEPGTAAPLFTLPGVVVRRAFAVSSDGRRFLAVKPFEGEPNEPITVVLNWQGELAK